MSNDFTNVYTCIHEHKIILLISFPFYLTYFNIHFFSLSNLNPPFLLLKYYHNLFKINKKNH